MQPTYIAGHIDSASSEHIIIRRARCVADNRFELDWTFRYVGARQRVVLRRSTNFTCRTDSMNLITLQFREERIQAC